MKTQTKHLKLRIMKASYLQQQAQLATQNGGVKQLQAQRNRIRQFVRKHKLDVALVGTCLSREEKAAIRKHQNQTTTTQLTID